MQIKQNPERLAILKKIEELEKDGLFDVDAENDPPTRPLKKGECDFTKRKLSSKIKAHYANKIASKFIKNLEKNHKFIIKEIKGLDNFNIDSGYILTCNHFHPFDSFATEIAFHQSKYNKGKKLYHVIREGNYTSFPGFYGKLMKECYTLPLSENKHILKDFLDSVNYLLNKKNAILVYPEQSMWWNYKKPKPLKSGAFNLAVRNNVPIIPMFITMEDSDILDDDGFFVQKYTINIAKPIYPKKDLSKKENITYLLKENYNVWKTIYEEFYHTPLKYKTVKK